MEKELKEVAEMQRKRVKKVIDPMKSLVTLDASGYRRYLSDRISDYVMNRRDTKVMFDNIPWLIASCFPLAYLTKSIAIPGWYFAISCYYLLFSDLLKHDCYFCRQTLRTLSANEEISIEEMHRRR